MAHTISIASSKGGTGKTTTALNLAVALAERGQQTLLVDLDPQGAIGLSLARGETEWPGLAEHLMADTPLDEVMIVTKVPTFTILPRGRLDAVDICEYESYLHSSPRIGELLAQVAERFEYVIFDCPSGLGMVTRAVLAVADFVLIPLQAEPLALRAAGQALRVIDHVSQNENPDLQLLGILPTMVELRQDASMNVMAKIWSDFGGVLDTCVPRAEIFGTASESGLPVTFLAGRTPPEARRFELLAAEIESRIAELGGTAGVEDDKPQRELI